MYAAIRGAKGQPMIGIVTFTQASRPSQARKARALPSVVTTANGKLLGLFFCAKIRFVKNAVDTQR